MSHKKSTVRSHYLPRTYLKHFLLNDELLMYKKGEDFFKDKMDRESRILTVIGEAGLGSIGLENHLYDINIDGFDSDDIEEIFGAYGENFYDEVIASVESMNDDVSIPQPIKDKLCLFLASMRVRTPQFKSETEEMASGFFKHNRARQMQNTSIEELREEYKKIAGIEISEEMANKVRATFIEKRYELKYPNAYFLQRALMSLDMFSDIFHGMKMSIFRSKSSRYFITSDNPVVYFVPQDKVNFYNSYKSLASPHTELFFSLTKGLSIFLSRRPVNEIITTIDREKIDVINFNISHNSFKFIFSPLKMNALNKFVDEFTPYPFKFAIH